MLNPGPYIQVTQSCLNKFLQILSYKIILKKNWLLQPSLSHFKCCIKDTCMFTLAGYIVMTHAEFSLL